MFFKIVYIPTNALLLFSSNSLKTAQKTSEPMRFEKTKPVSVKYNYCN